MPYLFFVDGFTRPRDVRSLVYDFADDAEGSLSQLLPDEVHFLHLQLILDAGVRHWRQATTSRICRHYRLWHPPLQINTRQCSIS